MAGRATTETVVREAAEQRGWIVATSYNEGHADVRYSRGDVRICATYGPRGRITDLVRFTGNVIQEFMGGDDTGKRARLLELIASPKEG